MKKLITLIGVLAVAWSVEAQNFLSQSFLTVKSISVGTNTTRNLTNLNSTWLNWNTSGVDLSGGTNTIGLQWTNLSGVNITNTQLNAAAGYGTERMNPFSDVSLWTKRDGSIWDTSKIVNNYTNAVPNSSVSSNYVAIENLIPDYSPAKLTIRLGGYVLNGGTATFVFTPIPNGTDEPTSRINDWTVGVAWPLVTNNVVVTNVPMYLFNGCSKLRLRTVTGGVTFNGATTSNLWIHGITLSGFVP